MAYKVTCRCRHCGLTYEGVIQRKKDDNPPCPNVDCASRTGGTGRMFTTETRGEAVNPIVFDPAAGIAPAVGGSAITKAVDATAQIVMEDHHMTNLQDNLRPGDTMAPKLHPVLQQQADNMFSGAARGHRRSRMPFNQAAMMARINSGSLSSAATRSPDIVGLTHAAKLRPSVTLMEPTPPPGQQRQRPGGY